MTQEILANLWYFILVLVWAIYLSQELFVTGVGVLSLTYDVADSSFKKINESVGTFWDGIQVWLIVAIGGLFAAFPTAYALTLQALYIPFFLLLFTIIARGTSIELIFKSEDPKWQKFVSKLWGISSIILMLIEGVYLINLIVGLPIKDGLMTENFLSIFSRAPLLGGALLVLSSISLGYCWIKITLGKEFEVPSKKSILWISGSVVFITALLFLSLTNEYNVFETGKFAQVPILWIMPIFAILSYVLQFIFHVLEMYKAAFVILIIGLILVLFTGFTASFPYILPSTIDVSEGLLIIDAASSAHTLNIISGVSVIFIPIVIGYQTWKYIRFGRRF